jgi:uncharacterized membrane protein SpoIIM required for sporulation
MKETSFIEQNKKKWQRFQQLAANEAGDPEELADLYSDITDDLSYAQTFYNRRTVRVYLNQIAQGIHNLVHKERSDSFRKFFTVWKTSLPLEIYRSRKSLFFALCVFLFWAIVGAITTHSNPDFPRLIMGDGYVEMTLKNIAKGDPLGVYHDDNQWAMFFRITMNNIKVAFYTFIFGVFFTIGTHIFIFNNAIMLGSFQYFFQLKGLLLTSFLGIWIHGAFEISAIVIAGGAGITLGNGLLFPGSYTRLQGFQLSAKRGLKIMMSLVPFLIMAGFLESFVTHNYQSLTEWSKWTIILCSFGLIIFYYIIYPIIVARKHPELVHEQEVPVKTYKNHFVLTKIRDFGAVFSDTFSFYRVHIGKILRFNLLITFPIVIAVTIFQDVEHYRMLTKQHEYDWVAQIAIMMGTDMKSGQDWLAMGVWSMAISLIATSVFFCFQDQSGKNSIGNMLRFTLKKLPAVWLGSVLLLLILFLIPWYWQLLFLFLAPLFWVMPATMALEERPFWSRYAQAFSFGARSYGSSIFPILVFLIILFLFAQLIAFVGSYQIVGWMQEPLWPDFLDMLAGFVKDVSKYYFTDFMVPANLVRQLVYVLFIFAIIPLFVIMMGFIFFDVKEKQTATGLRKEFEQFGKRKRNQESTVDVE